MSRVVVFLKPWRVIVVLRPEVSTVLGTRDWQKAQDTVWEWEATGSESKNIAEPLAIQEAGECLLADARAGNLNRFCADTSSSSAS